MYHLPAPIRRLDRTGHTLTSSDLLRKILVQPRVQPSICVQPGKGGQLAMASLVKIWITRYVDKEGRRVSKGTPGAKRIKERSTVWYGQYKVNGKWQRVPLFTDKSASAVRLAELVKGEERGEAGLV